MRLLKQNSFPLQLNDLVVAKFLDKQYLTNNKPSSIPKLPVFFILPYLGVYIVHLRKLLITFLGKIYPMSTLELLFKLVSAWIVFPFKDRVPNHF